jgi:hypothetical protein
MLLGELPQADLTQELLGALAPLLATERLSGNKGFEKQYFVSRPGQD